MIVRCLVFVSLFFSNLGIACAQQDADVLRKLQQQAIELNQCDWAHWGDQKGVTSNWSTHSNRLIPVYAFGLSLNSVQNGQSIYRDKKKLTDLYGQLPTKTLNPKAKYFDQTDIYRLHKQAFEDATKKNIILIVFDGMDWETSHAASLYKNPDKRSRRTRDSGMAFMDYKGANTSDYGYCVTAPHNGDTKHNVNSQTLTAKGSERLGGYSAQHGGRFPWSKAPSESYLKGNWKTLPHPYTDSAASATSLNSGIKTYNGSINIGPDGNQVVPLAREMQDAGFSIGVVTSVPISHATPAAAYANNVTRNDYQDISRDLLGLPSVSHRKIPLPGVDVLIGCGWGENHRDLRSAQGNNFIPGNKYLTDDDLATIDVRNEERPGKYVVAQRTPGKNGSEVIADAADLAAKDGHRLLGFFGVKNGHLPYQTADGKYDPARGKSKMEVYKPEDVSENPTLAEMTSAALSVLEKNDLGFYLMIEPGDVDWANHNNNIDDSIGAVFSGEKAFETVIDWVEKNSNWEETSVIVTADHGHLFVLDNPKVFTGGVQPMPKKKFDSLLDEVRKAKAAKVKAREEKQKAAADKKRQRDAAKTKKANAAKTAEATKSESKS
jgi:alkaline phosphatase